MVEEVSRNEEAKKLSTMLPLDVYIRLLDYAKLHASTGLGTWDFGVAVRKLLDNTELLYSYHQLTREIERLNERVDFIYSHLNQKEEDESEKIGFGKKEEKE